MACELLFYVLMPMGASASEYGAASDMMDDVTRNEVLPRLRRIAGQLEGVARTVEDDRYCVSIEMLSRAIQGHPGL